MTFANHALAIVLILGASTCGGIVSPGGPSTEQSSGTFPDSSSAVATGASSGTAAGSVADATSWVASGGFASGGFLADGGMSSTMLDALATDAASTCPSIAVNAPASSVQPGASTQGFCLCTRRSMISAHDCPHGANQLGKATIGPEGGVLRFMSLQGSISGVAFELTVPPMALASPTTITITETSTPPPAGFVDYSPLYRIDPVDLVLSFPAQVRVPFSNGPGFGVFDRNLGLFVGTCTLQPVPNAYANAGFEQGSITGGGYLIVGYGSAGMAPYCGATADDSGAYNTSCGAGGGMCRIDADCCAGNTCVGGACLSLRCCGAGCMDASTCSTDGGVPVEAAPLDAGMSTDATSDAPSESTATYGCPSIGIPPSCFGSDLQRCCANDPTGGATCNGEQWTCDDGAVPAPGCNGQLCTDRPCNWLDDAGQGHMGTCAQGERCCQANVPNRYYCYSGDDSCPLLP
jgi:hypothetical protein